MKEKEDSFYCVILSYVIFGLLPLYWKLLKDIPPEVMLLHRIFWSAAVLGLILCLKKRVPWTRDKWSCSNLFCSALFLSINWFTYLYAITHDQILAASMGYFMSPVLSVFLGVLILGEEFSLRKKAALALICSGLLGRIWLLGSLPWLALVLCLSFSFYSFLHKQSKAPALESLFFEMLFMLLPATVLLFFAAPLELWSETDSINIALIFSGLITMIPLMLLTQGAKRVSMQFLGITQYLIPTLYFVLAVFVFGESLKLGELFAFSLIWLGVIVFCGNGLLQKLSSEIAQPRMAALKKL